MPPPQTTAGSVRTSLQHPGTWHVQIMCESCDKLWGTNLPDQPLLLKVVLCLTDEDSVHVTTVASGIPLGLLVLLLLQVDLPYIPASHKTTITEPWWHCHYSISQDMLMNCNIYVYMYEHSFAVSCTCTCGDV